MVFLSILRYGRVFLSELRYMWVGFLSVLRYMRVFFLTVLMPLLQLPSDEYTMPVRCPNHRFRAASAGKPCDHRTDLQASWPLRFCLTPHKYKFEKKNRKPVARRHVTVTLYDPRSDREDAA